MVELIQPYRRVRLLERFYKFNTVGSGTFDELLQPYRRVGGGLHHGRALHQASPLPRHLRNRPGKKILNKNQQIKAIRLFNKVKKNSLI